MANESEFLFHALLMGIFITFVYDILRVFRRVVPHGAFLVSLEDLAFWIYCTGKVFLLMYREGNGKLRWFAVLGALTGIFAYRKLISPYFVKYVSLVLRQVCQMVMRVVALLAKPLLRAAAKIREQADRAACRRAVKRQVRKARRQAGKRRRQAGPKNRLTFLRKVFKMYK